MWLWMLAAVIAYFVKGLCGFASTLVFTTILGFGVNNINISPADLIIGFPSNVILIGNNRKKLKTKVWLPLTILVILGSIPGAFILKSVDARYIKIIFGVVVVFLGIEMFLRDWKKSESKGSKILLTVIGILSGILCGMFGIGALLAAYVGRTTKNSDEFKANMCAVFFFENIFRFITYWVMGVMTWKSLRLALVIMPFMFLGLFLGMKSSKVLDERIMRLLVIILLIISGVLLVIRNI